jgi:hypothetical protein
MTDLNTVYIKIDDDIVFIKDGSFEHLVYQVRGGYGSCSGVGLYMCVGWGGACARAQAWVSLGGSVMYVD